MFIHITAQQGEEFYEWGFYRDVIPQIGSKLWLEMCEPDKTEESADYDYACYTVIDVDWWIDTDEVTVEVECTPWINNKRRFVSNSEVWPASEESKRRKEIEEVRKKAGLR